jgi:hypothetical protein
MDQILVAAVETSLLISLVGKEERKAQGGDRRTPREQKKGFSPREHLPAESEDGETEEEESEREVDRVVVAGERMQERESDGSQELPDPSCAKKPQEAIEDEREPLECEELQLEKVAESLGRPEEDRPAASAAQRLPVSSSTRRYLPIPDRTNEANIATL